MSTDAGFTLHAQLAADTFAVGEFELCSLLLMNDATYPWLILVPHVAAARELVDLDERQQSMLMREVTRCSHALQRLFAPDKLNVAALGNVVPQLHVHVIARHRGDPAWPAPIWGRVPAQPYERAAGEALLLRLRGELGLA